MSEKPTSIRLTPEVLDALDRMRQPRGWSRSKMLAHLVQVAAGDDVLAEILRRLDAIEDRLPPTEFAPKPHVTKQGESDAD